MNFYFSNYQLDDVQPWVDLDRDDRELLDACILIADYNFSIRESAKNSGFSKSQLHRLIHSRLKKLSFELHQVVIKRLKNHKKGR